MSIPSLLAVTLFSVPLLGAQTPTGEPVAKPQGGPGSLQVSLPVSGLSAENAAGAAEALQAITISAYVCPQCRRASPNAGACDSCGTMRVERSAPLVKSATADVAAHSIAVVPTGLRPLSLGDMTHALEAKGVRVDQEKLDVPGPALLVVTGGKSEEDAQAVVKALSDAQLYDRVRGNYDADSGEVRVRVAGQGRDPRYSAVAKAVGSVSGTLRLADVAWGGMPGKAGAAPGAKKGAGPQAGKGKKDGKGGGR